MDWLTSSTPRWARSEKINRFSSDYYETQLEVHFCDDEDGGGTALLVHSSGRGELAAIVQVRPQAHERLASCVFLKSDTMPTLWRLPEEKNGAGKRIHTQHAAATIAMIVDALQALSCFCTAHSPNSTSLASHVLDMSRSTVDCLLAG